MRRALIALAAASIAVSAVTVPPVLAQGPLVRVAAASDLQFALEEVAARLAARQPPIIIRATFASSGTLHAQLRQRAPYDVFLSADMDYPRDLVSRGTGREEDLFAYATGHLVVWLPRGSTLPLERDGLAGLASAGRIAIANPRHAPYGRAAEAALRRGGLLEQLRPRLVLGENVAQAAQFVQSGAADAGIIAESLARAPALRDGGRFWNVPPDGYPELAQGGLILPWATSREAARALRDFLLGVEGQRLLAQFGFGSPPGGR